MKRILPLVLLGVLIELACYIWCGIYLFGKKQATIPFSTTYKIENACKGYVDGKNVIIPYKNAHIVKFLSDEEYKKFQKTHIITYREVLDIPTGLNLVFFMLFIASGFTLIPRWVCNFQYVIDSYCAYHERFEFTDYRTYPFISTKLRRKIYEAILNINFTPVINKFQQFWGYEQINSQENETIQTCSDCNFSD